MYTIDVGWFLAFDHIINKTPGGPTNLSYVQHLFRIASHRKNLHFGGAQDFHILLQSSKVMDSMEKAL
jgi:hypothetical protein